MRAFTLVSKWLMVLIFVGVSVDQTLFAQSLTSAQGLSFGSFVASNGGTISVSPTGVRSQTGTVGLITLRSNSSAAQISLSGGPSNAIFSLGLPADGVAALELVGGSGGRGTAMPLSKFVSSLGPSPTLTSSGTQQFSVGATLQVQPNQPVGDYSATINVTVQFN
jgi:spore coat protein U-like protein